MLTFETLFFLLMLNFLSKRHLFQLLKYEIQNF